MSDSYEGALTRHAKHTSEKKDHPKQPKHKREMHIRELQHGHHVTAHHEDGSTSEYAAQDLDDVHDLVHEHFAPGEQGEGEPEENASSEAPAGSAPPMPVGGQE